MVPSSAFPLPSVVHRADLTQFLSLLVLLCIFSHVVITSLCAVCVQRGGERSVVSVWCGGMLWKADTLYSLIRKESKSHSNSQMSLLHQTLPSFCSLYQERVMGILVYALTSPVSTSLFFIPQSLGQN